MKQTIRLTESQFKKVITETIKKVLREDNSDQFDKNLYHVQETIDGWRQNAIFSGSLEDCRHYMSEWGHGSYSIVSDEYYEVDYL